jgi:hypothetical protein
LRARCKRARLLMVACAGDARLARSGTRRWGRARRPRRDLWTGANRKFKPIGITSRPTGGKKLTNDVLKAVRRGPSVHPARRGASGRSPRTIPGAWCAPADWRFRQLPVKGDCHLLLGSDDTCPPGGPAVNRARLLRAGDERRVEEWTQNGHHHRDAEDVRCTC